MYTNYSSTSSLRVLFSLHPVSKPLSIHYSSCSLPHCRFPSRRIDAKFNSRKSSSMDRNLHRLRPACFPSVYRSLILFTMFIGVYCDSLLFDGNSFKPAIERVQALADISRSALCCHSNETRAPIANPPNSAQLEGTPYHSPKLHPGPCSSMGMRRGTDTLTDRQTDTYSHRRLWPIYISPRLSLTRSVIITDLTSLCISLTIKELSWHKAFNVMSPLLPQRRSCRPWRGRFL